MRLRKIGDENEYYSVNFQTLKLRSEYLIMLCCDIVQNFKSTEENNAGVKNGMQCCELSCQTSELQIAEKHSDEIENWGE